MWTRARSSGNRIFDSINVGSATVVNDLVFTATYDGYIYAFNKDVITVPAGG